MSIMQNFYKMYVYAIYIINVIIIVDTKCIFKACKVEYIMKDCEIVINNFCIIYIYYIYIFF